MGEARQTMHDTRALKGNWVNIPKPGHDGLQ